MNKIEIILGEICKSLLPIPEELYFGNKTSTLAICTLASISLLKKLSESAIMNQIAVVGRLFSENSGIESLIKYVNSNKNIKTIILCGEEVDGHLAGHSLIKLMNFGTDLKGYIIDSNSPYPKLCLHKNEIEKFRNQVRIINRIGVTDPDKISFLVNSF